MDDRLDGGLRRLAGTIEMIQRAKGHLLPVFRESGAAFRLRCTAPGLWDDVIPRPVLAASSNALAWRLNAAAVCGYGISWFLHRRKVLNCSWEQGFRRASGRG